MSNPGIADALCIGEHTVKSHLEGIFQKVGVASRTQLIARVSSDPEFGRRRAG